MLKKNSILIKGVCKMGAGKKNNSISDSSTADSDSGYMEESEPEFCSFLTDGEVADQRAKQIISGFAGRAKNDSLPSFMNVLSSQIVNYGDDVGFICTKNLNDTEMMPPRLLASESVDDLSDLGRQHQDPAHLVNKYYFGLADGVSANRLRGYDAKLFPSALIHACVDLCDKSSEYYTNYTINYKSNLMRTIEEENRINDEINKASIEQFAMIFKEYRHSENEEDDEYIESAEYEEEEEEEQPEDQENVAYDDGLQNDSQIEMEENDCEKLKMILSQAHEFVQTKQAYGSSTVCLLSLEFYDTSEFSVLSSINVGDSGYMVIRDKKVLFKTQSQSHRYNAPYQLGCTPPELIEHHLYRDK